jgi:hypothetical protein
MRMPTKPNYLKEFKMKKMPYAAGLLSLALSVHAHAAGVKPVTTGVVIRAVNVGGPAGAPGTKSTAQCDFSREEVGQDGNMTGASVNCRAGGNRAQVIAGLPGTFNAYCVVEASRLQGRLIPAPVSSPARNDNHCDLSAMSPKNASAKFGAAYWR